MKIELQDYSEKEKESILSILQNNKWHYHLKEHLTREDCEHLFRRDYFTGEGIKTFLLLASETKERIGILRIFDLGNTVSSDETPLFDIRIIEKERNKGLGKVAVKKMVRHIFEKYPNKTRIEATTRKDNKGMRAVLRQTGFVKEAHYRESWQGKLGELYDTIGYGLLRRDWESGETTELEWDT